MVQAWLFWKSNADTHYANAVYNSWEKEQVVKNRQNIAFFNVDAKCKVPIGEPGYPIAVVTRGKKVIAGLNEKLLVTDHDFSKLSIIPDAYLLHEIPLKDELQMKKVMMICSIKAHFLESGILVKSFTGSNQRLAREVVRCDVIQKSQM